MGGSFLFGLTGAIAKGLDGAPLKIVNEPNVTAELVDLATEFEDLSPHPGGGLGHPGSAGAIEEGTLAGTGFAAHQTSPLYGFGK